MIMRRPSGQGVLELIIAIGIIVSSLGATFGLLLVTSQTSSASRSRILAANLAREGIEVARSIRDSNWLAIDAGLQTSTTWGKGLSSSTDPTDYSAVAVFQTATGQWTMNFTPDVLDATTVMYWNSSNGVYSQWPSVSQPDVDLNLGLGFRPIKYWRFITLRPICWDMSNATPESTEVIVAGDGSGCTAPRTQVGVQTVVRVQWERRGRTDVITLVEKLFNWKV